MRALLPIAIAACGSEPFVPPAPPPPEVSVGLASTRLGADCGEAREAPQLEPAERIPCDQTAVHLSVRAPAGVPATTIKMKRVELLDRNGKLIEVLTAHSPSRWGTESFVAWDESVVPGQTLAVGYKLTTPNWSKIPNANQRSFKMRITVTVGDTDRTMEATAELRIEDTSITT